MMFRTKPGMGGTAMSMYGKARQFDGGSTDEVFRFQQVGDEIAGTIIEFKYVNTEYGECLLLKIVEENSQTEKVVFASPVLLRRKLDALKPQPGDEIDILYHGDGDKGAKFFQVCLERDGQAIRPGSDSNGGQVDGSGGSDDEVPY